MIFTGGRSWREKQGERIKWHRHANCCEQRSYPNDNVVMVLDGAGWHKSKDFRLAENLRLLFLPPYSPQLNPQEHLWDELREKHFHNHLFDSLDTLEDHLVDALRDLENSPRLRQKYHRLGLDY